MTQRNGPASPAGRILTTVSLVCAALLLLEPLPAAAVQPFGVDITKPTINTYKDWTGELEIVGFRCRGTTNFGQVITIPAGTQHLDKLKFWVKERTRRGFMTVRAEVYRWGGSHATGHMAVGRAVFESTPRTIALGSGGFHKQTFNAFGAALIPGAKYVLFVTLDKDDDACHSDYELAWAGIEDAAQPVGSFVYLYTDGDESQWTTEPWTVTPSEELAFKAYLSA